MAEPKPRIKVPNTAKKGDLLKIKTLISHIMETGLRKEKSTGKIKPRKIINKFIAKFNGEEFFSVDIDPALSENPYFQFYMKAEEPGNFEFIWFEDGGKFYTQQSKLEIIS